jgi:hypothetical protein
MAIYDFIFTPFGMIASILAITVAGGAYYWFFMKDTGSGSGSKKILVLIRPGEKRALEIPIIKETAHWLYCKTMEEVPRKFYKVAPGYVFPNVTKFFAIEGIGYTADAKTPEITSPEPTTIDKALRILWGDERYEKMPKTNRKLVEECRWGLTISIEPYEGEDLPNISSEALREKDDEAILKILAEDAMESKKKGTFDFQQILIGAAIGALIVYIAVNQGWLRIAGA